MSYRYSDYTQNGALVSASNAVEAIFRTDTSGDAVSLAAWRERCRKVNTILTDLKRKNKEALEKMSETYADRVIQEHKAEQDSSFEKVRAAACRLIAHDFDTVMAAKREAYERAHDGPDESTFRLVSTLSMRSKVSSSEMVEAARKCAGNLQALRLLAEIAERNGLMFPHLADDADFERAVEVAEGWKKLAVDDCAVDPSKMTYGQRIFWTTSDLAGQFGEAAIAIDSPAFLAAGDSGFANSIRAIDEGLNATTTEGVTNADVRTVKGASEQDPDSKEAKVAAAIAFAKREKAERDATPLKPRGMNAKADLYS